MRNFWSSKDCNKNEQRQADWNRYVSFIPVMANWFIPECVKNSNKFIGRTPPANWAKECPVLIIVSCVQFSSPNSRLSPVCPGSLAQPGGWPWELSDAVALVIFFCGWMVGPSFPYAYSLGCLFCCKRLLSHECMSLPLFLWLVNFWSAILRLSFWLLFSPLFHFPFLCLLV